MSYRHASWRLMSAAGSTSMFCSWPWSRDMLDVGGFHFFGIDGGVRQRFSGSCFLLLKLLHEVRKGRVSSVFVAHNVRLLFFVLLRRHWILFFLLRIFFHSDISSGDRITARSNVGFSLRATVPTPNEPPLSQPTRPSLPSPHQGLCSLSSPVPLGSITKRPSPALGDSSAP
jgi:hypothetical protein